MYNYLIFMLIMSIFYLW